MMAADLPSRRIPLGAACADGCCLDDSTVNAVEMSAQHRGVLNRRVRLLVAATIYNVIEGIIAIAAGTVAGSTALVGFGLDSTMGRASCGARNSRAIPRVSQ